MARELTEQLTARVKHHLYKKERKATDFITQRRSETSVFESQVASHDRAIGALEKAEEGFDKEAYLELKAEIKRRREAKERLLQQGFPELKPYVSI